MKENNYAFIDSQNLNLGVSTDIKFKNKVVYKGWKLDFKKFRKYLLDKYSVKKAFLFIGYLPENKKLYKSLTDYGFTLVYKPTVTTKDGVNKGNVDAELVLHSMIEFNNYDNAVIVSGDGDFHCLIEYLKLQKKLKKLLVPNSVRYSSLLKGYSKDILFIDILREKLKR